MDTLETGELPVQMPASNGHAPTRPSRHEMRQRRRRERDEGVPFHLDHDDIDVRVRLLNVYERATLVGLPSEIQQLMLQGFNAQELVPKPGHRLMAHMFSIIETEEETANELCLVGFVSPRLVRTVEEWKQANNPDVWPLQAIALNDRKKYLRLVMGQDAAELARVREFLRRPLAGVESADADGRGRAPAPTLRALEHAG